MKRILHYVIHEDYMSNYQLGILKYLDNANQFSSRSFRRGTNCKGNLTEGFQKEERVESMQYVVAVQHGWASKDGPGKFLFFKVVKCSMCESSYCFYRQVVIRSETEMRQEEYK